jgi:hypothetical protein
MPYKGLMKGDFRDIFANRTSWSENRNRAATILLPFYIPQGYD